MPEGAYFVYVTFGAETRRKETPHKTDLTKLHFRQVVTTLALIGGEGLYCLYYPLPTSGVAAVNTA